MAIFEGSCTALVTPFFEDGSVNYEKLAELVEYQIENETDALVICGSTGEASTLTDDEQIECVRVAVVAAKGRVPIIAGAGSNDTHHGQGLCRRSQEVGADAVLVVTPYYNKTSQKGLLRYYEQLCSVIDIPMVVYNIPVRTGLNILPQTILELSKLKNIAAVKEGSGDVNQVVQIAALLKDNKDFAIYSGDDNLTLPMMSVGGLGVISVVSNILPKETHDMCRAFLDKDTKKAAELQLKMYPLVKSLFADINPVPVKAAMNLMGFGVGPCREPLWEITDEADAAIKRELGAYGLI